MLEVYQQALQSDPAIHEAEARRLAALEAKPQARGALLPQVGFGGSWERSDTEGTSIEIDSDGSIGSLNSVIEDEVTSWGFELRQSLFRWDQIVGLRRADKTVARAEAVREAAQQDLILRVAQRYFDVLAAEDRLRSIHADRQAIARQLEQAKQRFEVGLIAITDVQESQAAYDQSIASEIAAKRVLATAREFLREITGEYVAELSAPQEDFPLQSPDPSSEREWVDLSLSQNLSLVASRLDERLARDEISFRRNGHYPSVELVARSGERDTESDRSFNNSPFIPADSDGQQDSIAIEFNLPLFAGGATSSRVKEAVYLHRASREQLQRVTRETERLARDAYLGVISEMSRVQALKQAVASSSTALEATQAGFEVGTRTIVDVLNSQFALYAAITNYEQSRYDYIMNVLRLKQAAGTLQVQDLEEIDTWLVERKTPEQIFSEEAAGASGDQ
ncbi:MAG: TolC family outer membrane protein [Gammaproteobacteria bacterium]|nr:TolC family outer membrane protein [Gammaproteobacteria bacterium]NNF50572.1 TolC family outer membrane protein [Woeseiaceae bacterium]MBT8094645.1 TolC family outer membrane protein [Gammaproteobacteria bacterium]MBT8106409.1 TolC family outer membrane protein [Gammaproteobacteria bacterium]NNK26424.1 TolC family outer membrane protein [Woeseiaceae bacterium]